MLGFEGEDRMEDGTDRRHGLVDAAQFLRVSDGLKEAFAELGAAGLPPAARERWQRRLLSITNLAKHDLDRAERQFQRFRADFAREHGEDADDADPGGAPR